MQCKNKIRIFLYRAESRSLEKSYEEDKNAYFSAKPPLIVPPKAVSPANV